jgi:hypothetical protein
MWSCDNRARWSDLDAVEEPTDAGRALYAGGFVLADPFDTILRNLSEEYLEKAWNRTHSLLKQHEVNPGDLTWAFFHGGETHVPGLRLRSSLMSPGDYIGWSSRELYNFDYKGIYSQLDSDLRKEFPKIACIHTWRSLKWRIPPNHFAKALRLIEALCIDEATDWSLDHVLQEGRSRDEPWVKIAQALRNNDQRELDVTLEEAKATYTPIGYRVVLQGYTAYARHGVDDIKVRLPNA